MEVMQFTPQLTPEEMLERGVFGASYFHDATDEDYLGMRPSIVALAQQNDGPFDKRKNYYEARAGEDYAAWMRQGWIFPEDPLGWFHWYCRFASGRRHARDEHQIGRWERYGARWGRFARTQLLTKGDASAVVKQGLLQWAWEPMLVLHNEGDVM
jgi:hypothetical protein